MSYRTKIPKNAEEAHAEITKGIHEMNRAQERFKKAQRVLLHDGNTPGKSSAH